MRKRLTDVHGPALDRAREQVAGTAESPALRRAAGDDLLLARLLLAWAIDYRRRHRSGTVTELVADLAVLVDEAEREQRAEPGSAR